MRKKTLLEIEARDPCDAVEQNLTTTLPAVVWKVEYVPSKLGDLATEISKARPESATWFFNASSKI